MRPVFTLSSYQIHIKHNMQQKTSVVQRRKTHLNVSSISVMLVSFSTTRKLGLRFLLSSPTPPSRNPVQVSSSPITAISFPRPAIVNPLREKEERWGSETSPSDHMSRSADRLSLPLWHKHLQERPLSCSHANRTHSLENDYEHDLFGKWLRKTFAS